EIACNYRPQRGDLHDARQRLEFERPVMPAEKHTALKFSSLKPPRRGQPVRTENLAEGRGGVHIISRKPCQYCRNLRAQLIPRQPWKQSFRLVVTFNRVRR